MGKQSLLSSWSQIQSKVSEPDPSWGGNWPRSRRNTWLVGFASVAMSSPCPWQLSLASRESTPNIQKKKEKHFRAAGVFMNTCISWRAILHPATLQWLERLCLIFPFTQATLIFTVRWLKALLLSVVAGLLLVSHAMRLVPSPWELLRIQRP